jgi:sarcosine oxidase gamma subunit
MHDVGTFWTPTPDPPTARLDGLGFTVVVETLRQTLISGALDAGIAATVPGLVVQGPYRVVETETYAIRLGIDRALIVSADVAVADRVDVNSMGARDWSHWHPAGFAASDVGEAYAVMTVSGPAAFDVFARGTGVDLRGPAPASGGGAVMRFAEITLIAYRYRDGLRLHVERPRAPYLWELFAAYAQIL